MQPQDYLNHNRNAWDRLAKSGNRFAKPASKRDLQDPLASVDGPGWLGKSIAGKKVLCLAAGGGRQGPIYATAGGEVTVVDLSPAMLELDQQVARKLGLNVRTVHTSMDDLSMFGDSAFDIVIHPVSTCYIPSLEKLFAHVARVTKSYGIYISQHKQPASLQTSIRPGTQGYFWEFESSQTEALKQPAADNLVREPGTLEYVHSLQAIIGGICRSGFSVEDLSEPEHGDRQADIGSFKHRSRFVNPYVRIKAVRNENVAPIQKIWSPQ